MRPQGSLAVFTNAEMPRKRSYLVNHHRHHLHGRIMMHFSLSWQTTHNLSSLSRSTSLSSWNVMFDQGSPPRSSPDPLHYQCYPSSSCRLSPQPADNSSSSSPASPSRPLSPPPPLPPERRCDLFRGVFYAHQIFPVLILIVTVPSMSKHWHLRRGGMVNIIVDVQFLI